MIMVSGGFDPLHIGHVYMLNACAELGDVVVALNSDEWLKRKKGYVFMPWIQRAGILYAIKGVIDVVQFNDDDDTCLEAIKQMRPTVFANGGDRVPDNTPEVDYCLKHGIALLFNAGGKKVASSSDLVRSAAVG